MACYAVSVCFETGESNERAADILCCLDNNLHLIRFVGNTNEVLNTAIATVIIMGLHSEVALG